MQIKVMENTVNFVINTLALIQKWVICNSSSFTKVKQLVYLKMFNKFAISSTFWTFFLLVQQIQNMADKRNNARYFSVYS